MARKSVGRMINKDISLSAKIASLSCESMALFCLLIPHFDSHGKMLASPYAIKGNVCPLINWLTIEKIESYLEEISAKTNVKWWQDEKGLHYLQSLNWTEHQDLRTDRLGADRLPDYPGTKSQVQKTPDGKLPDNSRTTPGVLPPEVEVEVEEEGELQPPSAALRLSGLLADLIADNNPSNLSLRADKREATIKLWSEEIDRMLRLDGRPTDEAEQVIRWCQSDSFWQKNILSGSKIRKQYDQLVLGIKGDQPLPTNNLDYGYM